MLAISPVLADTYGAKDYAPAASNINAARIAAQISAPDSADSTASVSNINQADSAGNVSATEDSSGVDARRYTKFDRSAADAGEDKTFSFSDFLDAINPLQHIPVVSSVYRAATGEKINPVAHITGDLLYGGMFGGALAALGGIGDVGNAMMEAQSGKDSSGAVVASLFDSGDDKKTAQVAQNSDSAATPAAAAPASTVTPDQQIAAMAAAAAASTPTAANPNPTSPVQSDAVTSMTLAAAPGNAGATAAGQGFPLDRSKMAYGGVMDPSTSMAAQNTAIALSESSHAMRLGHTIYTSRLMNGPHPLPIANNTGAASDTSNAATTTPAVAAVTPANTVAASDPAASPVTASTTSSASLATAVPASSASIGPQRNPLPQNLIDDMVMMKGLSQYHNMASSPASLGASVDISN